jgi:dephospho-CoA kinase
MGYKILDTDEVAHNLLKENSNIIIEQFSDYDICEKNGEISRKKLGKIVFSDKKLKEKLENILHPLVRIKIEEFYAKNEDEEKVFVSIPQLFESGMQDLFDKIIFIYASDRIRLKRLILRDNYNEEYAKIRMNSQISQDEKIEKSDIVIYNNSSLEDLESEIKDLVL